MYIICIIYLNHALLYMYYILENRPTQEISWITMHISYLFL